MKTARSQRARKSGSPNFESSRRRPASLGLAGSAIDIVECTAKLGKFEMESAFQKSLRPATPPGQREARFGAHEKRADVRGPRRNRRAPRPVQNAPQLAHEFGIRDRIWTGDIEDARELGTLDRFDEHARQIRDVDPAHVLAAVTDTPAQKQAGESCQNWQRALVHIQHDADSHHHFPHSWRFDVFERAFPALANFFRETLSLRRIFVAPAIARIAVDRERAGLDPDFRWFTASRDSFAQHPNGIHTRFHDLAAVFRRVPAVHAPAREFPTCFRAIDRLPPIDEPRTVPMKLATRAGVARRAPAQQYAPLTFADQRFRAPWTE